MNGNWPAYHRIILIDKLIIINFKSMPNIFNLNLQAFRHRSDTKNTLPWCLNYYKTTSTNKLTCIDYSYKPSPITEVLLSTGKLAREEEAKLKLCKYNNVIHGSCFYHLYICILYNSIISNKNKQKLYIYFTLNIRMVALIFQKAVWVKGIINGRYSKWNTK